MISTDIGARMTDLAVTFPTLRGANGVNPWDADELAQWLRGPVPGSGAKHAACFVLSVWNPHQFRVNSNQVREALELPKEGDGWNPAPLTIARMSPATGFYLDGLAFNVTEAFGAWDKAHRAAFLAWASDPWWP